MVAHMFDKTLLTAPLPDDAPAVEPSEGWLYDSVDDIDPALLRHLCTGEQAAALADAPVGPELAAVLARLDVSGADAHELVEAVAACARLTAWVAAIEAAASAELASRPQMRPDTSGYRSVNPVTNTAMELAGRCQVTARQAENQVGHALQLTEDFPDTHTTLSSGLIDVRRARVITDELGGQDPDVRTRVEAAVLPKAPKLDAVALRKLIRRLLHELAPVEQAERHRAARDRRYVAIMPASDGMAHLEALLPAEDATALNTALNVAAADAKRADTATGAPARTKDQRRADALAALGWAALTTCAEGATSPLATAAGRTAADAPRPADRTGDRGAAGRTTNPSGRPADPLAANASAAGTNDPGRHTADHTTRSSRHPADPLAADPLAADPLAADPPTAGASEPGRHTAGGTTHSPRHPADPLAADPPTAGTNDPGRHTAAPANSVPGDPSALTGHATSGAPPGHHTGRHTAGPAGRPPDNNSPAPPTTGAPPRRRPIAVHVTIPFATQIGLSDEPGELEGYGPIPAHVARALAAEGVWTWLRTDPGTGELLQHGRTKYRPSAALADLITARDRTCRAPGCHRPARAGDIDHIVPFAAGGATAPDNLHALCTTHHLLKHRGHWSVQRQPDGATRWTGATRHHYVKPPERIGPGRIGPPPDASRRDDPR